MGGWGKSRLNTNSAQLKLKLELSLATNIVKHENHDIVDSAVVLTAKKAVKEKKTVKFEVASHMRDAGKKVLENTVYRFNPILSRPLVYVEDESRWDLKEDFSAEHTFSLQFEEDKLFEMFLEGIEENWRSDPIPAQLLETRIE